MLGSNFSSYIRSPAKNVFPPGSLWRMLAKYFICMSCKQSVLVQVLVLADLHNTTQLKLHVLKFINDRRVAEASFLSFVSIAF